MAGFFQGVIGLPVLLTGGLLHKHKGRILKAPHKVVLHGGETPGGIIGRVVVPADYVHLLGPLEVVQALIGAHQVGGNGGLLVVLPDGVPLHFVILQKGVGEEPVIVDGDAREGGLAGEAEAHAVGEVIGGRYLVPVVEGVPPELRVPGGVHRLQGAVLPPQPNPESLFAVLAVAAGIVLVIYVPAHHMGVAAVPFGQLPGKFCGVLLPYKAVGAVVVPLAKLMPAALKVHPGHLGIFLRHPGGHGSGGRGQHDVYTVLAEQGDYIVQLREVVGVLVWLQLRPGEHIDRGGVDIRLFKQFHVLGPYFPGPLVRVVVAAVQYAAEGGFHGNFTFLWFFGLVIAKPPLARQGSGGRFSLI